MHPMTMAQYPSNTITKEILNSLRQHNPPQTIHIIKIQSHNYITGTHTADANRNSYSSRHSQEKCTPTTQPPGTQQRTTNPHTPRKHIGIVELKFTKDINHEETLTLARTQHQKLISYLSEVGHKTTLISILLGNGGTIFNIHTFQALKHLSIPTPRIGTMGKQ
jgi:hypothetical protein